MDDFRWFTPDVNDGEVPIRRLQYLKAETLFSLGEFEPPKRTYEWIDVPEVEGERGEAEFNERMKAIAEYDIWRMGMAKERAMAKRWWELWK